MLNGKGLFVWHDERLYLGDWKDNMMHGDGIYKWGDGRIFQSGGSQAVRLPKEFRFDDDEVCIKRIGTAVLLFPKESAWQLLADAMGKADDDFLPARGEPKRAERRRRLVSPRS